MAAFPHSGSTSFGTGVHLSGKSSSKNFRGIFISSLGPGPTYTREEVERTWNECFGYSESYNAQPSFSSPLPQVLLVEDYGTKNFAVYGLPKDYKKHLESISPSLKYTKLQGGDHGFLFPKEDMEGIKEYMAQSGICFTLTKKKKEKMEMTEPAKEKPKQATITYRIVKNKFGNHQIAGTDYVVLNAEPGVVILVGKQDAFSSSNRLLSVIPMTDEERDPYRGSKKLIVLDEHNIDDLIQKYPSHKDFFMRMVFDQDREEEDE